MAAPLLAAPEADGVAEAALFFLLRRALEDKRKEEQLAKERRRRRGSRKVLDSLEQTLSADAARVLFLCRAEEEEEEEEEEVDASDLLPLLLWPRSSSTAAVAHFLCWFSW